MSVILTLYNLRYGVSTEELWPCSGIAAKLISTFESLFEMSTEFQVTEKYESIEYDKRQDDVARGFQDT